MAKEYGYGQLQHSGGAPSFARGTGAAPIVKSHAHSKNTFDQAKKRAPNSGQTKGG